MGTQKQGRKVVRVSGHRPFGGDERVDRRTGISTENHMELYARLIRAGREGMHGTPSERVKRTH